MAEEISPNKRYRTEEFHNFPFTPKKKNVTEENLCSECKEIDILKMQVCQQCSYLFCSECIAIHKKTMITMYPSASEPLCSDIKAQENLEKLQRVRKENEEKLLKIQSIVCGLTEKKAIFQNGVNEMYSELKSRRDHLLDLIEEMYKEKHEKLRAEENQVIQEYDKELKILQKIETDLKMVVQSTHHLSITSSSEYIGQLEQCSRQITKRENMNSLFEFKRVRIIPETLRDAEEVLENLIGKIDLYINNICINEEDAYATSVIYKNKDVSVADMCYDAEKEHLFILEVSRKICRILKISGNEVLEEFKFQISVDRLVLPRIALLPNRCILLLLGNKLNQISKKLKHFEMIHEVLEDLHVSLICASVCVTQTYIYSHSNSSNSQSFIAKYDSYSNPIVHQFSVPELPHYMAVNSDQDHIAFGGTLLAKIYLYSLKERTFLHTIGERFSGEWCGCFLSEALFISHHTKQRIFELIKFKENRTIRNIKKVYNLCRKGCGFINVIAPFPPNGLFICCRDGKFSEIYQIVF